MDSSTTIFHSFARALQCFLFTGICAALLLTACSSPTVTQGVLRVTIIADGREHPVELPAGSTVQAAIEKSGIKLNSLDRIDPPSYTLLTDQAAIRIIRVEEVFEVEERIIPFERQTVRNESLPDGQVLLVQPGVNGIQQVTHRQVLEDGQEVSRSIFEEVTIIEPRPEIVMVGVQSPFTSVPVSGTIAYLTAGNAWVISESTGNRRPVVSTGDLDGRVFELSSNGEWLLFTRQDGEGVDERINSLWMVDVTVENPEPVYLGVDNVIHYAGWVPNAPLYLTYSTVEPRSTAPGWQANNELMLIQVSPDGDILKEEQIIETNSGGIYGWWGTDFAWSPDGSALGYARADSVGVVDFDENQLVPVLDLLPYQTRSDWAWVPAIDWSPDARNLYTVQHAPVSGLSNSEESPLFHLTAVEMRGQAAIELVSQTGMFAYPAVSPPDETGRYQVAYLQAIFPEQSETSRYRLVVMDRDGSNRRTIFPAEGAVGLDPQEIRWAPRLGDGTEFDLAFLYQNNLWLIDSQSGRTQQVTGDRLIDRIDWKN